MEANAEIDAGWSASFSLSRSHRLRVEYTTDGTRGYSSAAVLVLPQPTVPFSQMIT